MIREIVKSRGASLTKLPGCTAKVTNSAIKPLSVLIIMKLYHNAGKNAWLIKK